MVDDRLLSYVKDQKSKGVHPGQLKFKLEQVGWSRDDVERVVHEVYSTKKLIKGVFLFIFVLFVFLIALIYILSRSTIIEEGTLVDMKQSCYNITNDLEKDSCYYGLVNTGFDCDSLENDVERTFCFRALDDFVISN
ncbi:hypothetical protein K9L97_04760 [Candidatus Woesearchaeota archaeon]|nr:hypothetical protein [Candidatus Woesearchaeota archaeon]